MAVIVKLKCPKCSELVSIATSAEQGKVANVECPLCKNSFKIRRPASKTKPSKPSVVQPSAKDKKPKKNSEHRVARPPADDFDNLLNEAMNPSPMPQSREFWTQPSRRFRLNKRAMRIAAITAAFVLLVGAAALLIANNPFRVPDIGLDLFESRADSVGQILGDWRRSVAEQETLVATIDHKSDCARLMPQMERLLESQTRLLVRAVELGLWSETIQSSDATTGEEPAERSVDLPAYPIEHSGRRPVEVFLTTEFRQLEQRVTATADVVLGFLHQLQKVRPEPEPSRIADLELKYEVTQAMAQLQRAGNSDEVAVKVYEVRNRLQQSSSNEADELPDGKSLEATNKLLDLVIDVFRARYASDPESTLAKALSAFQQ